MGRSTQGTLGQTTVEGEVYEGGVGVLGQYESGMYQR